MKNTYALLSLLMVSAALSGCDKLDTDDDPATPPVPTGNTSVFDALIADNTADETQNFITTNQWSNQLVALHGTELNFSPGAFVHPDGTPVTGQIQISVIEVLTVGKMIWLNKQTVGNDNGTYRMLRSGGALNITASQAGDPLKLVPGALVVNVPTTVGDPAMDLFSGAANAAGQMIWTPLPTTPVAVIPAYIDLFYSFSPDSLNWINCDYFASFPNLTPVTATIPAGQSTDSTMVWMAFPSENMVVQMPYLAGQTYSTPTYLSGVPIGYAYVMVGLRQGQGGYLSSFTYGTVTPSMNVTMTFSPTTLAQFENAIDAL
jgi:hypothetical protein